MLFADDDGHGIVGHDLPQAFRADSAQAFRFFRRRTSAGFLFGLEGVGTGAERRDLGGVHKFGVFIVVIVSDAEFVPQGADQIGGVFLGCFGVDQSVIVTGLCVVRFRPRPCADACCKARRR